MHHVRDNVPDFKGEEVLESEQTIPNELNNSGERMLKKPRGGNKKQRRFKAWKMASGSNAFARQTEPERGFKVQRLPEPNSRILSCFSWDCSSADVIAYLRQFESDGRDEAANRNGSNGHSAVPNNDGARGGQERNREEYETRGTVLTVLLRFTVQLVGEFLVLSPSSLPIVQFLLLSSNLNSFVCDSAILPETCRFGITALGVVLAFSKKKLSKLSSSRKHQIEQNTIFIASNDYYNTDIHNHEIDGSICDNEPRLRKERPSLLAKMLVALAGSKAWINSRKNELQLGAKRGNVARRCRGWDFLPQQGVMLARNVHAWKKIGVDRTKTSLRELKSLDGTGTGGSPMRGSAGGQRPISLDADDLRSRQVANPRFRDVLHGKVMGNEGV
ncbi:hypothetical protein C8R44DRAFT_860213 [Mycena epipterygia]|nr:hypothetical protein C8R44DRAFT_860213 [Mycena epipterygia]